MHIFLVLFVLTVGGFAPNIAFADEFGERFYNQAPSGLGDYTAPEDEFPDIAMDDIARSLQDIMPASGEEEPSEVVKEAVKEETSEE